LLPGVAAFAAAQDFDLLIRGGRIVDGAGNPAWHGDIGIRHADPTAKRQVLQLQCGSRLQRVGECGGRERWAYP
jgi:hypothetical protein